MLRGCLCALVLFGSVEARADKGPSASARAAAEALFNEGRELGKLGRHEQACPKFAESMRLDPQLGTQMNLAACYEEIGKLASAWINFHDAEISARRAGQEKRALVAGEHAAALEPRLSHMAIDVPSEVASLPDLAVERDGEAVRPAQFTSPLPVDSGVHLIRASAKGKLRWEKRVEVSEEAATYTVKVPELTDAPQDAAAVTRDGRGQRIAGFVVMGLGIAGLGVGAAFGALALKKNSASKDLCLPSDPNQCKPDGIALRDTAIAFGNGATAALVIGGVAAATGLVVALTAPSAKSDEPPAVSLVLTPTGAMMRGTW